MVSSPGKTIRDESLKSRKDGGEKCYFFDFFWGRANYRRGAHDPATTATLVPTVAHAFINERNDRGAVRLLPQLGTAILAGDLHDLG